MNSRQQGRNRAACRRCQRRKIRCNGETPTCGACLKANVPCVNEGKQEVNRTYIANLQRRVQWLESLVREQRNDVSLEDGPPMSVDHLQRDGNLGPHLCEQSEESSATSQQAQSLPIGEHADSRIQSRQAHEIGLVSLSSGTVPRYIGPSSGYFLANLVFASAGRKSRLAGTRDGTCSISLSAELFNSPASLPSRKEDAIKLSSNYFSTFHLLYPLLHEPSHMQRLERVYAATSSSGFHPSDAFHVYMVLAIAASDLSRRLRLRLPAEGYYTAAAHYFEDTCADGSIESLQGQLLLMVYALHNPSCGVNVWGLNYQCLAALIDLGLQRDVRASPAFQISVLEQEMRTRIFWVIYTFDRALGTMMGRPIGVRDEACELRFPSDSSDAQLASGNVGGRSVNSPPSHMTYSIHLFRLARLNSEIKYIMHSVCREPPRYAYPPVPDIQVWQRDMVDRLKEWHITIPRSDEMESITRLCECKYHEMMVLLLRASPAIPEPSEISLTQCFRHATSLVRGLGALYIQDSLLYSRFVVHSTFLSILLILHCLWKIPRLASQVQISDVIADTGVAISLLSGVGEHWAEATRARDCVQELSSATIQRLLKLHAPTLPSRMEQSPPATGPATGRVHDPPGDTCVEASSAATAPANVAPGQTTVDVSVNARAGLGEDALGPEFPGCMDDSMSELVVDFAGASDFDTFIRQYLDPTWA
ncbi:Positive regulator of purine utilization [Penicillium ucsense]|uniref:Positive regulator of purine utilization n=1 Tax=Penicillium ucsense TaxID=2839758 RepID=A0A8J8W9I4_9EURO|nr:Positive regulator of purine utilization [Penicillium ucsense]KAF7739249.1 Positive regulator of purine utilization [Penicillium ucsense]